MIEPAIVYTGITTLISLIGMIVAVMTFNSAVKERHSKSAAETAQLKITVENLAYLVQELKGDIERIERGFHTDDKRITKLETRVENYEARIEVLEKEVLHHG